MKPTPIQAILTEAKLRSLDHISTLEVEADLLDARKELHGYETEKKAIESVGINMTNKIRHYFLSAKCDKGHKFIAELEFLLAYRKKIL